jgi:two-component system LytT family response regulator
MEKLKILVVEDSPEVSAALVSLLHESGYEIAGTASTLAEALSLYFATDPDLVILDIYLHGQPDGISFAEAINAVPAQTKPFIFVTSTSERTIFERAKLTKPFSYLMKPFNPLEVTYAIEMALEHFYEQKDALEGNHSDAVIGQDAVFVKKKDALVKLKLVDVLHVEVQDRYCNLHTLSSKFVIQMSMAKVEELLNSKEFVRIHRNHLVQIDAIQEIYISDNVLKLANGQLVPVGVRYKDVFQNLRVVK